MKRIADEQGRTLQDVHLAFIKYANGRGNQWLTQGLKGFAPLPRFEEPPKENPMKTEILERAKLPDGTRVRLQKRGNAYDVITNSTGITWRYLEKAVSEERARNAFNLYTMQRKKNPIKTTQAKRKPTPAQLAARERFAEMARSGAFKKKAKRNPAKKTVSQKISQLTREGYSQRQAVAIALNEERAGKVKRNPRASNPVKRKVMKEKRPFYYVVKVGQSYDGQFSSEHYSLDDVKKIAQQKADKYGAQAKITELH
jgi:hypothetical protein